MNSRHDISATTATEDDAAEIAALHVATRQHLAQLHGGRFSHPTERSVRRGIATSRVLAARIGNNIVATLRLDTRKPWAIDLSYFTPVPVALYLHDMAVEPGRQRQGVGRALVEQAKIVARAWPSQAIRLDAYDAAFGAGEFYAKCGFVTVGRARYRRTPLIFYELVLVTER